MEAPAVPCSPRSASRKHVALSIGDDGVRTAIAFALEASGFVPCTAGFPSAADCFVLDCAERGSGFPAQLAHWRERAGDRPIVVLATAPDLAMRQACRDAEAVLVEKPLLGDALIAAIASLPGMEASAS